MANLNNEFTKIFEPLASPPKERIKALKILKENGIRTYLFISPIFPGFSDVQSVVEATRSYVDFVIAEALNYKCGIWGNIEHTMKNHYPQKRSNFMRLLKNERVWDDITDEIKEKCEESALSFQGLFLHK